MAHSPAAIEACLAPLAKLAARAPDLEGQVIWWRDGEWQSQDDEDALLDAEEIAFYAEGLMAEGFGLQWLVLAQDSAPRQPAVALLFFWEGARPAMPAVEPGWLLMAKGHLEVAG